MFYQKPSLCVIRDKLHPCVSDWRIRQLVNKVCQANGDVRLHLHELSNQLHITASHMGKRFKQQQGINFRTFATKQRDQYVCALLRETDLPMKEIAARAGYKQLCDLSHRFRLIHDMSPSDYRNRFRLLALNPEPGSG
jgi:transcriptional regulator GlxA family with amidase domain